MYALVFHSAGPGAEVLSLVLEEHAAHPATAAYSAINLLMAQGAA